MLRLKRVIFKFSTSLITYIAILEYYVLKAETFATLSLDKRIII